MLVGNTDVNPCLPRVWEGEHTHSTYARQLTLRIKRKISNGGHVQAATFKTVCLQWSCEVCASLGPIFQHAEPAYSQHKPNLKTSKGSFWVDILQTSCVHPLEKLRKSLGLSNASYCQVRFHFSDTHLRLSQPESIALEKVLLEPVSALNEETKLPPHFQDSFKSSHYSTQPERKEVPAVPEMP